MRAPRTLSFEPLEDRTLLSAIPFVPAGWTFHPDFAADSEVFADSTSHPDGGGSPDPSGMTPTQMRGAYGLGTYTWNSNTNTGTLTGGISFNGNPGTGAGETIAIVDAYDDPHALSDLDAFSSYYNLPDFNGTNEPTFQKLNETGGTSLPSAASIGEWAVEESLDIEWAHSIAPLANIILFEANAAYDSDLFTAVQTAASTPGVVVVSMSWSGQEMSGEQSDDASYFVTPPGHPGVTYLAATGDSGAYAQGSTTVAPQYPAVSPNVVAVGGTTLDVDANNNWSSESVWGSGTNSGTSGGGGGGISEFELQPTYQTATVGASFGTYYRTYPDVSADANPYTGVPVYDSYDFSASQPWAQYGGTSLATPMWSAMIAVADQGRSLDGESSLDGPSQTLPMLYNLPASDFHDITAGGSQGENQRSTGPAPYTYNTPPGTNPTTFTTPGFVAETGYDLTSGIGSPRENLVIPALVSTSQLAFAQGPTTATAGAAISPAITVDVENASGGIDTTNSGYVTLAIGTNPSGGRLLGTVTVKAVNGVATFSGLSVDTAGTGYTLVATLGSLTSATSAAFNIAVNSAQPTIVTAASANSSPVTGTTTTLSVEAGDPSSQALTYTWSAISSPAGAAPTFSPNGTASASTTTATFSAPGAYTLLVVFTDGSGTSQDSSVAVTVVSTLTSLQVSTATSTVSTQSQEQFTATGLDQFGNYFGPVSSATWSAASGTMTPSGLYTAPAAAGSDIVTVTSGGYRGSAAVTIAAPVGWWKLNEGTGATADDSGGGTADNGAIASDTWVQAPAAIDEPYALQFSGSNTVVRLGNPSKLQLAGQLTLAAWIKPTNITKEQYIVDEGTIASNDLGLLLVDGNYAVGGVSGSTVAGAEYAIPSGDLNAWVFLAATYDGNTWRLYRDGQLVASNSVAETSPGHSWEIGADIIASVPLTTDYFNGAIGDVRVYGTAISSGAIAALAGSPPVVTAAAAASPNPVTGTTAALSVAASDDAGPSALTYTWTATGTPPAAVYFSRNGTSAAYSTTARFTQAGKYYFTVTIANAAGFTAASSLVLTVNQTPTAIGVVAGSRAGNDALIFTAVELDQFGNALPSQPTVTWSLNGGTVSAAVGNQLTTSVSIAADSLLVTGGGNVAVVGTNSNSLAIVDLGSGTFVIEDPSILATGANLAVGNAALFAPIADVAAAPAPATAPKRQGGAAGNASAATEPPSVSSAPAAPFTAQMAAAAVLSSSSPRNMPALATAPSVVGPALPARLEVVLQAAAAVLAQQGPLQSDRGRAAEVRAVDAIFAQYGR
jgi:hypothetical protein